MIPQYIWDPPPSEENASPLNGILDVWALLKSNQELSTQFTIIYLPSFVYFGLQVKKLIQRFQYNCSNPLPWLRLIKLGTDGANFILPVALVTDDMVELTRKNPCYDLPSHRVYIARVTRGPFGQQFRS